MRTTNFLRHTSAYESAVQNDTGVIDLNDESHRKKPVINKKHDKFGININIPDFDTLLKETVENAGKLMEYFRLNLIYYQLVSGKGLEFDRIKDYVPGNDPRRIDWKIFAKTGELHIRAYKEERQFDIILVIDVSNSMLLGTGKRTKNEFAMLVAGTLGFAATESGDKVAVMMLSDEVEVATDPDFELFKLLSIMSDKRNYGGNKAWHKMLPLLMSNYREDSIIFIISDFIDTDPEKFLPELAAYFSKVYGIMVRDPVDEVLPKGVGYTYLKDVNGNNVCVANLDEYRDDYEVLSRRQATKIRDSFHDYDQLFFRITTDDDFSTGFIKALGEEKVIIL